MHYFASLCTLNRSDDKPGSVVGSYLSRPDVANRLKRSMSADQTALQELLPYASCCGQGLPGWGCHHPHRWALTPPFHPCRATPGGLLSVALALGLLRPSVRWSPLLRAARTFLSQRNAASNYLSLLWAYYSTQRQTIKRWKPLFWW